MNNIKTHKIFKPIKISQATLQYGLQEWLETIFLVDDAESRRLSDWTVGYYHCKQCNTYQGFSYRLEDKVDTKAHNERLEFMLHHAHGDGRIMMFDQKM